MEKVDGAHIKDFYPRPPRGGRLAVAHNNAIF